MIKPTPLKPDPSAIPLELKQLNQWVLWRYELRGDKWTKVPHQARHPNQKAKADDPSTWANFEEAVAAYSSGKADGIGFVFSKNDPYTGIDLDFCVEAFTGEIDPWALGVLEEMATYTELSPSATGLHLILRGKLPEGGRRKDGIEFYDRDRFFTMTGWVVDA